MGTKFKKDGRKVLLFVPFLAVPFLALTFYAMGGGKGQSATAQQSLGINTNLPNATFSTDTPKTKADYYEKSKSYQQEAENGIVRIADQLGFSTGSKENLSPNDQTKQINDKLNLLSREINKPETVYDKPNVPVRQQPSTIKSDVDRLEAMMKTMQENKTEDPEMTQLNSMMQNILDIQYPQRMLERQQLHQSLFPDSQFRATRAIIVNKQKAVQGATIKIKLQDSLVMNGVSVPKGHDLFGICRITNQRLLIDIKNIRLGTSIIPVDLSVYSLDGMPGIYAPEAMLTDAIKDGTNGAVGNIGVMGYDLTTQIAGAGLDAAKSLLSKKIKRIKIKLDAGSPILLRHNKQKIY